MPMKPENQNDMPEAISKQILIVNSYTPELSAEQETGQATIDKAKITFFGTPSPSSDPNLKYAKIYFVEGILSPPRYDPKDGTIHIFKAKSSLTDVLIMLQHAKEIFCTFATYPISIYGDVHCNLPAGK